ncbi:hypothetical protein QYF36_017715 [Acer negundo]|nr:hypothetical protein QYF36_017715 [Acer negundo]
MHESVVLPDGGIISGIMDGKLLDQINSSSGSMSGNNVDGGSVSGIKKRKWKLWTREGDLKVKGQVVKIQSQNKRDGWVPDRASNVHI